MNKNVQENENEHAFEMSWPRKKGDGTRTYLQKSQAVNNGHTV